MSTLDDDPTNSLNFDWESEIEEEIQKEAKALDLNVEETFPPTSSSGEKSDQKDDSQESCGKRPALFDEPPPIGCMPPVVRRKKKRKGMPKRPLSAYNIFFQKERPRVLGENSDLPIGFEKLGKIIGQRWRALTEEERKEFEDLAEKDSIRYRKEMEIFNETKRKRAEAVEKAEQEKVSSLETDPPPFAASKITVFPVSVASPEKTVSTIPKPFASQARIPGTQVMVQEQRQQQQPQTGPTVLTTFPPLVQQAQPPMQPLQYVSQHAPPQANVGQFGPARANLTVDSVHHAFPVPPGMEVAIPEASGRERRYKVQYAVYSMSQEAAQQYIESLTTSGVQQQVQLPHLPPQHQEVPLHPQQLQHPQQQQPGQMQQHQDSQRSQISR